MSPACRNLESFFDGELAAEAAAGFRAHLASCDRCQRVLSGRMQEEMITDAAVTFIWSADIYRMSWRYGERGYRYIFLDAGHVCQNLYLAAQEVGCGVCAVAAFDDAALNRILMIDGERQFAVYLATLGKI